MYLVPVVYATGLCGVHEWHTFHREWPPQLSGTWYHSCAAPFFRQSGKTWRPLILVCWFLVRLLFVLRMSASRRSDSTPDCRSVTLCIHDYRAFRTVQAAPLTATAVGKGHGLVGCGNGGNSML